MGLLVDGKWQDKWYDTKSNGGKFERQEATFRHAISAEKDSRFPAESGALSFVCITGLSVGASHADHASLKRAGVTY